MPAFSAIGAYVAGTVLGLTGSAALVAGVGLSWAGIAVASVVAIGASYITSRIINGNPNKGSNSVGNQGGRVQLPPASNNKIPVLYGQAYMNGVITDAWLTEENQAMYYCIVLSETCNVSGAAYTVNDIYWNDMRLVFESTSGNRHKVNKGVKTVDATDDTEDSFIVDGTNYAEVRVYAGDSTSSRQIFPLTDTPVNAYTYWPDTKWTSTNRMEGLVFAIVKVKYNQNKGFTSLPNMTFKITNSVSNPAEVWRDYMTGKRYGAGVSTAAIPTGAGTSYQAWYDYCEELVRYTDKTGSVTRQKRYAINGVVDTSQSCKANIDSILQNGGAWMSYDISTGYWRPIIKKAVTAGFRASRSGTTLTVSGGNFYEGRIEPGMTIYNVSGVSVGTIVSQITPLTGVEMIGQEGRYTMDTSGTLSIQNMTGTTLTSIPLAFSDDNILSGISISSTNLTDLYNGYEVEFFDKYNKDQRAYARANLTTAQRNANEPDNVLRMGLEFCNNSPQADIIGAIELKQSRDDLVIEFTASHYGIQAQAGDIISVTNAIYGWAPKYFRVMRTKEVEREDGGLVAQITALEYNADVYTVESVVEFTTEENIGISPAFTTGASTSNILTPEDDRVSVVQVNDTAAVPNIVLAAKIPTSGGPYDEIQVWYAVGPVALSPSDNAYTLLQTHRPPPPAIAFNLGKTIYGSSVGTVSERFSTFDNTYSTVTAHGLTVGDQLYYYNSSTIGLTQDTLYYYIPNQVSLPLTLGRTYTIYDLGTTSQATWNTLAGTTGQTYVIGSSFVAAVAGEVSGTGLVTNPFELRLSLEQDGTAVDLTGAANFAFDTCHAITISGLPSNVTGQKYYFKIRVGVRQYYSTFTDPDSATIATPTTPYQPGGSSAGFSLSGATEGETIYYDATIGAWKNTNIITINDSTEDVSLQGNLTINSDQDTGYQYLYFKSGSKTDYLRYKTDTEGEHFDFSKNLKIYDNQIHINPFNDPGNTELMMSGGGYTGLISWSGTEWYIDDNNNAKFRIKNDLQVDGNEIKSSTGATAITLSGADVAVAGDLTVTGNDIKSSSATAITLSGADVAVAGDLTVTGNDIKSSSATAITLSGSNVSIPGDLAVDTNTLFVDSVNNRVGIGIAVPSFKLDVQGNTYIGGDLRVLYDLQVEGNDIKSSTGATAITLSGSDVSIAGNLTINGTTTTVNSTVTTLDDPIITLGGDTAPVSDDNKDRGVEFRYYDTQARLGFFGYDDSQNKFVFLTQATNTSEVFSGTKGEIDASVDWSNILNKPDPVITLAGDLSGSVTLTDLASGTLTATIVANAVALGTDTTGNYVATVSAGTGISVSGSGVETAAVTITNTDLGSSQAIFKNVAVSGQSTVVADTNNDTLTFAGSTGLTITTNATTDTVTFTNSGVTSNAAGTGISVSAGTGAVTITNTDLGSSQNIFKNIAVSGQTTVAADNNDDTLTYAGSTGLTITTDATTDTITFTNSGVTSIAGTANQITASASTGSVTLSTPQDIHTGASPTFAGLTVSGGNISGPTGTIGLTLDQYGNVNVAGDLTISGNELFSGTGRVAYLVGTELELTGSLRIDGNTIKASDNATNITMTSNTLTAFAGDIKVSGNDIQDSTATNAVSLIPNGVRSQRFVRGAIRDATSDSNGDVGSLGGLAYSGISLSNDNTYDSTYNAIWLRNYSGSSLADPRTLLLMEGARGTSASPLAVNSGNTIFRLVGSGYNGTNWATDTAASGGGNIFPFEIAGLATQSFTSTNWGTKLRVRVQPNGVTVSSSPDSRSVIIDHNPVGTSYYRSDNWRFETREVAAGGTGLLQVNIDQLGNVNVTGIVKILGNQISNSTNNAILTTTANATATTVRGDVINLQNATGTTLTSAGISYTRTYGEFAYTAGTITPAATNTVYAYPLDTTLTNSGTTISNTSRININVSGVYKITMSLQAHMTTNSVGQCDFWLRKNGTNVANSATIVELLKDSKQVITMEWIVSSAGSDYWEIMYAVDDTNLVFPYDAAISSPYTRPAVPPIIVNVIPAGA